MTERNKEGQVKLNWGRRFLKKTPSPIQFMGNNFDFKNKYGVCSKSLAFPND